MRSLSEAVELSVEAHRSSFLDYNIEVELNLDNSLSQREDLEIGSDISLALSQFHTEIIDVRPTKAKYLTTKRDKNEVLEIYHNGPQLPVHVLDRLNNSLLRISSGKMRWKSFKHGNLIAAQRIMDGYKGRVTLHNINENGYNVKTTVEIPSL